jgi:NADH-quinone oxidoreductase subunit J
MTVLTLFFYIFAAVLLGSAAMVVTSRNPVHSVLFLILAFFNAAALFLIAGAEFLAMILVIVYVGAVAVLFLFVVMMLDVNFVELREGFQKYAPVGAAVGVVLFGELAAVLVGWDVSPAAPALRLSPTPPDVENTVALGRVLYTQYLFLFQGAGLILLVAMVGAIVLTHRDRHAVRRQDVARQHARRVSDTLELVDVRLGAGVREIGIYRPKPEPALADPDRQAHEHAHGSGQPGPGEH